MGFKMPFKKRRKSINENTKEKKAIATRLMVISLKIDDYIYKNKPISVQDAEMYLEEIATYKLKCVNDVRSLQVIEKLTLFMKSIIKENITSSNPNENFNIGSNVEVERVKNRNYTLISPNNVITNNNKAIADDLINNENNNQNSCHIGEENNIEMETFTNSFINCSKMILINNTNNVQYTMVNTNDAKGNETSCNVQDIQNEPKLITVAECNINVNDFEKVNGIEEINQKTRNYDYKTAENNKKRLTVTKLNKTCKFCPKKINSETGANKTNLNDKCDKIEIKTKKINRKPKNKTTRNKKENNNRVKNNNKTQKTKTISKKKSEAKKKCAITKGNIEITKTLDPCNKPIEKTVQSLEMDNVIIDLSWVENIKYVREICKEEYDLTNTLEESFWSDLTLPVNWNVNDFDYTD